MRRQHFKEWWHWVWTAGGLAEKPKGMAEKQVLAWWLRQRTTAGRRWVSERLCMGEESGVSKAIRRVKESRGGELNGLKQRLLKGLNDDGEKNRLEYD